MSYTVYTPDVERGPTAYTQHTFGSLDELISWATGLKLQESPVELPVEPPVLQIDTSALTECKIVNAPRLKKAIDTKNWDRAAIEYMYTLCSYLIVAQQKEDAIECTISEREMETVVTILQQLPVTLVCKTIIPGLDGIGSVLQEHIADHIKDVSKFPARRFFYSDIVYATHPFVKDLLQIHHFSHFKTIGQSWKPIKNTLCTTICTEYLAGNITEKTREHIMSVLFMTYYCSAGKTGTIGSSELFEEFSKMEFDVIPLSLSKMVKEGMTYRHIKHALSEIMVGQVRRSDGQRYVGITRPHTRKPVSSSVLSSIYDDDMGGLAAYNKWPVNLKPV